MIPVPRCVWNDLRLYEDKRRGLAGRCCFIGLDVERTRCVLDGFPPNGARSVIEAAALCGYSNEKHGLQLNG